MTKPPQLALALLGTAITVVVMQYARNVDQLVGAPPAAAYGVQGSNTGARNASRPTPTPDLVTSERAAAMPVAGSRARSASGDATGDVDNEELATPPTDEPSTIFGIPLPNWLDEMLGKRRSPVPGAMPVATAEIPATPASTKSSAQSAAGCKHDLAPNFQGITAQVEFVGVLLNGEQRASNNFSGAELDDLNVLVQWKNLLQNHAQRVDLIAPDGSLYQSLSRLVTVDDVAPVETRVPVNGSWITRYGLYGSWCVEIFIDQESAPVTSSRLVIAKPQ